MRRYVFFFIILSCLIAIPHAAVVASPVSGNQMEPAGASYPAMPGFPITAVGAGFFSSPTVVDVFDNGRSLIFTGDSGGCIWAFLHWGDVMPGFPVYTNGRGNCDGGERINNSIAAGDIDGDNVPEFVAGTRGRSNNVGERGKVWAVEYYGAVAPGWPQEMDWSWAASSGNVAEVYSVALSNMLGSPAREIIAGTSNEGGDAVSLYAWNGDATLLPGYPNGYAPDVAAGIFGHVAAGDVDNDGYGEIVVGRDHIYTHVYDADGEWLPNWPQLTYLDPSRNTWDVDKYVEFTRTAPAVADLDSDGLKEIIIAGKVRDPGMGGNHPQVSIALLVFNADGERRQGWEIGKTVGPPIPTDYPSNNAVTIADLDNDGGLEIIVSFEDGTIRAYREDGTQLWTYNYAQGRKMLASEVVVGDVTGDNQPELIFGTYALESSVSSDVAIQAMTPAGQFVDGFWLTPNKETQNDKWGFMAAPTLADIDNNCSVELLAHSRGGTLYAWQTQGTNNARVQPWPTSRQNMQRTGEYVRYSPFVVGTPQSPGQYQMFLPLLSQGCQ